MTACLSACPFDNYSSKIKVLVAAILPIARARKMAAHSEACLAVGVSLVPLVVEVLGGWSDEGADTIRAIGRLQGQRLGFPTSVSTRHLFQRLAICLWWGNAGLCIRRLPFHPPIVDGQI